ncbi:hypothetical protein [Spirosoma radiotolerans]|uniref:Uncharacterized protein n=1 Tax=Spirosoma radiotolerans TaxID=1379870 RepID=A0A0E3ZVT5_9BACT|nr:hypothetical protein [Spirosoma radiotolerans]AKD56280.1 hypothetical protein SD10_16600 [Spirosoma radiotolerans]
MKKTILAACVVAALCGNTVFANMPSQDKPVSKTMTTTVKKSTPTKATTTTKTMHKKHVKTSE